MCHNSVVENEQIEKCIENGMPRKLVKTLKYTMRKRAANEELNQKQLNLTQSSVNNNNTEQLKSPEKVSKCPFGHGKFLKPSPIFFSAPQTTPASPSSAQINKHDFSNKNLSSNVMETDNGNAITNLNGHFNDVDNDNNKIYNEDILAKSTQLTREFAFVMQQAIRRLQSSRTYTLLTKTTQPAHIVAIVTVSIVLLIVWPELIDYGNNDQPQEHLANHGTEISVRRNKNLALIAYMGAFSTHFGAQIWMTFVSGLSLYFSLPRHVFGQCQQILFPKYFAMNATLSISMLIIYVKFLVNTWTLAKYMQLASLALSGAIELLVGLYLAPPLLRLMLEKYKIEDTIGSGQEIGSLVQGDLKTCPYYQRVHKAFRRIHMTAAIGNMITIAASFFQLYYLAGQLQISIVN